MLNLVFEPHVQTNGKPAAVPILFFRQVMAAFVFFRILVSVISLEQKNNRTGAGIPFVSA